MTYDLELKLESGAYLQMLMFDNSEHRWIFSNRYIKRKNDEKLEEPKLVNDTTLLVNYNNGESQDIKLTMDIVRPDKRIKAFFEGEDIPKDSRIFLEIPYKKTNNLYKMSEIQIGSKILNFNNQKEGLVKSVEFPFPLKDIIENEFGSYKVPFLRNDGTESFFEFSENYSR